MPQTTVIDAPLLAFAGRVLDRLDSRVASAVNEEASAEMRFGIMVAQGTADRGALLLAATSDDLKGVVVHSHSYDDDAEIGDNGLKPDVDVGCLDRGQIWVRVEEAVAVGDSVYVRAVATGAEVAGAFRVSVDGTDTIDISTRARWVGASTTDPDGNLIAPLDLNLTNS